MNFKTYLTQNATETLSKLVQQKNFPNDEKFRTYKAFFNQSHDNKLIDDDVIIEFDNLWDEYWSQVWLLGGQNNDMDTFI